MAGMRGGGHSISEDICSQKSPICADPDLLAVYFSDPVPGAKLSCPTKLQPPKAIPLEGGKITMHLLTTGCKEHGLACGEKRREEESSSNSEKFLT